MMREWAEAAVVVSGNGEQAQTRLCSLGSYCL